jgi:hypothetical protein
LEPMMDALSKLVENLSHSDSCMYPHAIAKSCSRCQLAALRPVIEKLVEAGNQLAHSELWPPLKADSEAWDAALASWRRMNGGQG